MKSRSTRLIVDDSGANVTKEFQGDARDIHYTREKLASILIKQVLAVERHWLPGRNNDKTYTMTYPNLGDVSLENIESREFELHARSYAWQFVSGLASAYFQLGLAHGDVKPSNVACKPRQRRASIEPYYVSVTNEVVDVFEITSTKYALRIIDLESARLVSARPGFERLTNPVSLGTPSFHALDKAWGKYHSGREATPFQSDIFAAALTLICVACSGSVILPNGNMYDAASEKPPWVIGNQQDTNNLDDDVKIKLQAQNLGALARAFASDFTLKVPVEFEVTGIDTQLVSQIRSITWTTFKQSGVRMLEQMLHTEPSKRPTYSELLQHRYFVPLLQKQEHRKVPDEERAFAYGAEARDWSQK